jgi:hypothetical protein
MELYYLNGCNMPKEYVMTPAEQLDPREILSILNVQVRAEFIRKVGLERVWAKMAEVVDIWQEYELGIIEMAPYDESGRLVNDAGYGVYLKMHNPSVPEIWHIEGVGPECTTVAEALHWRKPHAMRQIPVADDGEEWFQQGDVCIWPEEAKSLQPFPSKLT